MDESDELSGLEGILALTWVSLAVISCIKTVKQRTFLFQNLNIGIGSINALLIKSKNKYIRSTLKK